MRAAIAASTLSGVRDAAVAGCGCRRMWLSRDAVVATAACGLDGGTLTIVLGACLAHRGQHAQHRRMVFTTHARVHLIVRYSEMHSFECAA